MHFKSLQLRLGFRAALLGLLALITSLCLLKANVSPAYSLGNIFLFLAASSSGGVGSCIAVFIAEGPLLLTGSHDFFQVIHTILFLSFLGIGIRKQSLLHPLIIFLPIWWIATELVVIFHPITFDRLAFAYTLDIFMLAMARLLLLSPLLSLWVFGKQHRVSLISFIPEILFILLSTVGGIVLFSEHQSQTVLLLLANGLGPWFFVLISFLGLLPVVLGMMLTQTLITEYGIELKNLIAHDFSKRSFVAVSRSLLGQRPDSTNIFRDTPKNSIGFSSDESIVFCSETASEILHTTTASLIGKRIQQTTVSQPIIDGISRLLTASRMRGCAQDEVRIVLPDGKTSRFIELSMTFTKETTDFSSGWLATVSDITHRRTVETELLRAKKIEMLGVMSHGIAHSVADALTVIQSITGLAQDNKTALEEIRAVAGNAGATIKQLLDYASDHQPSLEKIDITALIESRLEFFKQTIGDDGCIDYHCRAQKLIANIDERSVLQALSHVLLNAKESYASGEAAQKIELEVDEEEISSEFAFIQPGARAGHYARIRVKDSGEGISSEILNRVFDPLFSTKNGHTGLGLSVVFAVMRAHDGFLTAESTPKKGTTISLYFLLSSPHDSDTLSSDKKEQNVVQPTIIDDEKFRKAIIIEDDDAVRRILELLLKQLNVATESYVSGEAALANDSLEGDFFITDLILPGMQGMELAVILQQRLNIPGLIATGGSIDEKKLPEKTMLLTKPYGIEELALQMKKLRSISLSMQRN